MSSFLCHIVEEEEEEFLLLLFIFLKSEKNEVIWNIGNIDVILIAKWMILRQTRNETLIIRDIYPTNIKK